MTPDIHLADKHPIAAAIIAALPSPNAKGLQVARKIALRLAGIAHDVITSHCDPHHFKSLYVNEWIKLPIKVSNKLPTLNAAVVDANRAVAEQLPGYYARTLPTLAKAADALRKRNIGMNCLPVMLGGTANPTWTDGKVVVMPERHRDVDVLSARQSPAANDNQRERLIEAMGDLRTSLARQRLTAAATLYVGADWSDGEAAILASQHGLLAAFNADVVGVLAGCGAVKYQLATGDEIMGKSATKGRDRPVAHVLLAFNAAGGCIGMAMPIAGGEDLIRFKRWLSLGADPLKD